MVLCGALVADPGDYVDDRSVDRSNVSVVPAFDLNLSSVIFASAAEAASSSYSGFKANDTDNTMTVDTKKTKLRGLEQSYFRNRLLRVGKKVVNENSIFETD